MSERTLRNCRILVIEDEYMLADELRTELEYAGAQVLGPVGSVEEAIALAEAEADLDGGILDVNLGGEMVFPVADLLIERGIPFVFTTGYDKSAIPNRYADIVRCEKPLNLRRLVQAIGREVHA